MNNLLNAHVNVAVLCLCGMSTAIAGITNTWNNADAPGGNAPTNAYSWASADNWQNPTVPQYLGDGALLGTPGTAPRFIWLPDDIALTHVGWGAGNYLLGDMRFGEFSDGAFPARDAGLSSGTILFGDFYQTSTKKNPWIGEWAIAGYFKKAQRACSRTGDLTIRMDLWADSSSNVRTAPILDDGFGTANGSFAFYGPRGAPAQSGVFSQTAQSPYVKVVSMSGNVVPGSRIVDTAGIPEGTFVKYVFGDSGWLQLSEAATQTIDENAFSFAAITPSVCQTIVNEIGSNSSAGGYRIRAVKYREEDGLRLVYREVRRTDGYKRCNWGLTAAECAEGWIPGDIVISNFTYSTAFITTNALYVARMELPNVLDSHWLCGDDCDSRLTVPEGRTGGLLHVRDFKGKIEKRGDGTLVLGVDATVVPGSFKATEGRAKLYSTEDGQPLTLAKIELAAGATLEIPEAGLNVSNLVAEAGSCVCGPGKLAVLVSTTGVPGVAEGAELEVPAKDLTSDCVVRDGQWMHLDASKTNTFVTTVENGTNFVSRWNDVNGGACSARAFGIGTAGYGQPWIRANGHRGIPYLDLGPVVTIENGAINGLMRFLRFYENDVSYSFGASGGTLDPPYVKAAFVMAGTEYGGGSLLASAYNAYMNYGFVHTESTDFSTCIVSCKKGYDATRFGTGTYFYTNGVSAKATQTKFSGGWDVFTYTTSEDVMKSGGLGACCVAPGNVNMTYDSCYGGLLYGEVILYTNELTEVQIDRINAYLQRKWRGLVREGDAAVADFVSVGAGSKISVVGGGAVESSGVCGGGTVDGNLILTEDATFDLPVGEDGYVQTLTVDGKVTLPRHATVSIIGGKMRPGEYAILSFGSCEGDVSDWTVSCVDEQCKYSLLRTGNAVVLRIVPDGMVIFVR